MKRILIITSKSLSGSNAHLQALNDFVNVINQDSSDISFLACPAQELLFGVQGNKVHITLDGKELRELADVIHLRNINFFTDYANAIRLYADHYGIELVNRNDAVLPYYGKVSQGFIMALNGICTPTLLSSPSNQTLLNALASATFSYPMIIKHNDGIKGLHNYLVQSAPEAEEILRQEKQGFVAQPFIANSGELRILYFGGYVDPLIFKKQAVDGGHLNNTSRGGLGTLVAPGSVDARALEQATRTAEIMGRQIAGVDVLLGDDGEFYVLEANHTPSIAGGVFPEEKRRLYQAFFTQQNERKQA